MSYTARIDKQYAFEAAHQLPGHKGKCSRLHGHSYRVEVWAKGSTIVDEKSSSDGMLVDYGDIDDIIKPIIADMDHTFLSSGTEPLLHKIGTLDQARELGIITYAIGVRTTAENIARYLAQVIAARLLNVNYWKMYANIDLLGVAVFETAKTKAEYIIDVNVQRKKLREAGTLQ